MKTVLDGKHAGEASARFKRLRDVPDSGITDGVAMGEVRKILPGFSSPRVAYFVLKGKIRRMKVGQKGKAKQYTYSRADVVELARTLKIKPRRGARIALSGNKPVLVEVERVNRHLEAELPLTAWFQQMVERFRMEDPNIATLKIDFILGEAEIERRRVDRFSIGAK